MKKLLTMAGVLCAALSADAQVFCVQCFDQRAPMSTGVTNLVQNGSFETHTCGTIGMFCPNASGYQCDISNWTCTGGGPSTYASVESSLYSANADGSYAVYMGNFFCNACSSTTDDISCLVDSGCVVHGVPAGYPTNTPPYGGNTGLSLEQTVTGLTPGNCYVLEFWVGGEGGFTAPGIFALDLGFGKMWLRCHMTYPNSTDPGLRYVIAFKANAASHTIRFTNLGHICSTCTEAVLDDVMLYTYNELSPSVTACSGGCDRVFSCENDSVTVPNVFTPNGDGKNDNLEVHALCDVKITIYNRWGQELFDGNGTTVSWNGKYNNKDVPDGVYYYVLEQETKSRSGFVEVIR